MIPINYTIAEKCFERYVGVLVSTACGVPPGLDIFLDFAFGSV